MKTKLPFVLLIFVTGCATNQVWYQPGKTPAQAYHDLTSCKEKCAQALFGNNIAKLGNPWGLGLPSEKDFIRDCMRGEGWMLTPANTITNGDQYPRK